MKSQTEDGEAIHPQFENALNNLKSLSYSSGFSGSSNADALQNLLNAYDNIDHIDQRIKNLEDQAEREDERQKASVRAQANQEVMEQRKTYEDSKRALEEERARELARMERESDKVYEKFNATHEKELAKKKAYTEVLSEALKATEAGVPISEELKNKMKKNEKQKEEEKQNSIQLVETYKVAKADIEVQTREIKKIEDEMGKTQDHKVRQVLQEKKDHHVKRQEIANNVIERVHSHVDEHLSRLEYISNGKKAAEKKMVNQEVWKEAEKDLINNIIAIIGPDLLLEQAKKKGAHTVEAVHSLMSNPVAMQEVLQDAMKEAIKRNPNTADKIREMLDKEQKGSTSQNIQPASTPNVIKSTHTHSR